ncbi:hypothetical protein F2P81_004278 [Scophthalmus maximus]|uniref:Uncharacterized protein n=1 Tax=Scophthalmus maximus TaxID=52904 RepID=A0A6A4TJ97_SCOMX|nr:hypothetical protein F2P81_004278 [Scophthalmus maximus]
MRSDSSGVTNHSRGHHPFFDRQCGQRVPSQGLTSTQNHRQHNSRSMKSRAGESPFFVSAAGLIDNQADMSVLNFDPYNTRRLRVLFNQSPNCHRDKLN